MAVAWIYHSCVHPTPFPLSVQVLPDEAALADRLAAKVAEAINCAVAERGACSVGFSGGSLLHLLGPLRKRTDVAWDCVHAFLVDERVVPHRCGPCRTQEGPQGTLTVLVPHCQPCSPRRSSADSNAGQLRKALLDSLPGVKARPCPTHRASAEPLSDVELALLMTHQHARCPPRSCTPSTRKHAPAMATHSSPPLTTSGACAPFPNPSSRGYVAFLLGGSLPTTHPDASYPPHAGS